MSLTSTIVLFAVIWFMVFLVVLPLRLTTQGDAGQIVPGTPQGAPHIDTVGAKARMTTVFAILIWGGIAAILTSGVISVADFDWTKNLPPISRH